MRELEAESAAVDDAPARQSRLIILLKSAGVAIGVLIVLITAVLAFCINSTDAKVARTFADAVARWQSNPDFPEVTSEYIELGCAAMRCRAWGMQARTVIVSFRKLPGLPASLSLNEGSQLHYDDFSRGPVAAYLRLSGEQGVEGGVGIIEKLGSSPSDDQIRKMLADFTLPRAVVSDAGAIASVRRVIADVHPEIPFAIRGSISPMIQPMIQMLANQRGESNVDQFTVDQQMDLLAHFDQQIKSSNPELWRTKQVNDLLAGIWAQTYGQYYSAGITAVLRIRFFARIALVLQATVVGWWIIRRNCIKCNRV